MEAQSQIKDIVAVLGLFSALAGFAFGLYEYYIAQKWKKSEFASQLLEQLRNDESLIMCCRMLDWSGRTFAVPQAYSNILTEKTFEHNWKVLAEAIKPQDKKNNFTLLEMLYRDLFDHFFEYLESINHDISIGLITVDDVGSIKYWLQQLAVPQYVESNIFIDFLRYYNYNSVIELMGRFQINNRINQRNLQA
jgi:hypothetical protein